MNNRRIILYEPQKDDNCEFEVKKQAIDYYKSNYKILKNFDIVDRYQIYRPGYALESNKMKINISGDVFTSIKYIEKQIDSLNNDEAKKVMQIFKKIYHCYGNLIPCAEGVNTRWGYTRFDTYDLKMIDVKKIIEKEAGCNDGETREIEERIDKLKKREKVSGLGTGLCKKLCLRYWIQKDYIEKRKKWNDFVEDYYLQDFVDDKNEVIKLEKIENVNALELITKLCVRVITREYRIENRLINLDIVDLEKNLIKYNIEVTALP